MARGVVFGLGVLAALSLAGACRAQATASPATDCLVGAYRSPDGDLVALLAPAGGPPGASRYVTLGGARGALADAASPVACDHGHVRGRLTTGAGPEWAPVEFKETPLTFASEGVRLSGLLIEPVSTGVKPPLVVFVHGSEQTSPVRGPYQYLLAGQGVAVFAYDKRGTGQSQGVYTQDFFTLARDAANAAAEARKAAGDRTGRFGLFGGSQGGWVAPMAALESHADFVEVGFGVVGTALEQDQWQVDYQLKAQGFPDSVLPKAHEVTHATAEVAASNFDRGLDQIAALKARYGQEPWFAKIDGQYSGLVLRGELTRAKQESPQVPWRYSTAESLQKLKVPQLWVLAAEDSVAPSANTVQRLKGFAGRGAPIDIAVFPRTDHGIRLFTVGANGERVYGNVADGYFRLLADWAKGTLKSPYGEATFTEAKPLVAGK